MSQRVFVLDKNKNPLMPCHLARARQLLKSGKAAVFRRCPFTIILKDREGGETQPVQVKIDPGSQTTGIAVVAEFKRASITVFSKSFINRTDIITRKESRRSSPCLKAGVSAPEISMKGSTPHER